MVNFIGLVFIIIQDFIDRTCKYSSENVTVTIKGGVYDSVFKKNMHILSIMSDDIIVCKTWIY